MVKKYVPPDITWTDVPAAGPQTPMAPCQHSAAVDSAALNLMQAIADYAAQHHVHDGQIQATDTITATGLGAAWQIDLKWTITPLGKAASNAN